MRKFFWILLLFLSIIIIVIVVFGGGFGPIQDELFYDKSQAIVFSHRGVVLENCENSTEAFSISKEKGFSAIELDVSFTKDEKLVIFHDKSCERLLGIDAEINELTWEEIKAKPLIFNNKPTTNSVLLLSSFLKETQYSKVLYLDIKETSFKIANNLLQVLKDRSEYENIIIADGNFLFLAYLKLMNNDIKIALEGFNKGKEWLYYIIPKKFKPNFYSSFLFEVDQGHMRFLKENNLLHRKIVYGVEYRNLEQVSKLGLQNVIIDFHDTLINSSEIEKRILNNSYE